MILQRFVLFSNVHTMKELIRKYSWIWIKLNSCTYLFWFSSLFFTAPHARPRALPARAPRQCKKKWGKLFSIIASYIFLALAAFFLQESKFRSEFLKNSTTSAFDGRRKIWSARQNCPRMIVVKVSRSQNMRQKIFEILTSPKIQTNGVILNSIG